MSKPDYQPLSTEEDKTFSVINGKIPHPSSSCRDDKSVAEPDEQMQKHLAAIKQSQKTMQQQLADIDRHLAALHTQSVLDKAAKNIGGAGISQIAGKTLVGLGIVALPVTGGIFHIAALLSAGIASLVTYIGGVALIEEHNIHQKNKGKAFNAIKAIAESQIVALQGFSSSICAFQLGLKKLSSEIDRLTVANSNLEALHRELQTTSDSLGKNNTQYEQENYKLNLLIADLEQQRLAHEESHTKELAELTEQVNQLTAQINTLDSSNQALSSNVSRLEQLKTSLQSKISQHQENNQAQRVELAKITREREQAHHAAQQQLAAMNKTLVESQQQYALLVGVREELEQRVSEFSRETAGLNDEVGRLSDEINNLNATNHGLKANISLLSKREKTLAEHCQRLESVSAVHQASTAALTEQISKQGEQAKELMATFSNCLKGDSDSMASYLMQFSQLGTRLDATERALYYLVGQQQALVEGLGKECRESRASSKENNQAQERLLAQLESLLQQVDARLTGLTRASSKADGSVARLMPMFRPLKDDSGASAATAVGLLNAYG